jgi:hypothetical protein
MCSGILSPRMSNPASECLVFAAPALLPSAWRHFPALGPVRTFNPGLLRDGDGWLFAYRVVGVDGRRRIGLCRLDGALRIVEDSLLPLSDYIRFKAGNRYSAVATQWFADPRLYRLRGRVFLYWNSGWHEPRNWQFLQELDGATLKPRGHPRELVLQGGERQKLEKNWTFFEAADGTLYSIYSITPHRVLRFSVAGEDDIYFEEVARIDWSIEGYPPHHGGLRGGTPAVLYSGAYWAFCHSVHDGRDGYRYAGAAYGFQSSPPFAPVWRPKRPLSLGGPFKSRRLHARLNPAVDEVIYPCGAAHDGTRWLVSHGINDEQCALSILSHAEVLATLEPARAGV